MKIGQFATAGILYAVSSFGVASPAAASACQGDTVFDGRTWTLEVDKTRPSREMWASTKVSGWGPITEIEIGWWEADYGEDVESGYQIYIAGTGPATVEIADGRTASFTLAKGSDDLYEVQKDLLWGVSNLHNATVSVSTLDGWRRSFPFPAGFNSAWSTLKSCISR